MMAGSQSDLPCFGNGTEAAVEELRQRLCPELAGDKGAKKNAKLTRQQCEEYIEGLIHSSKGNWRTRVYDGWQYCCQGIF